MYSIGELNLEIHTGTSKYNYAYVYTEISKLFGYLYY